MKRRSFLAATAGCTGSLLVPAAARGARPERPNIIFCFSDEHRYQSMSFTEMPELHTPHMARMAREGTQFSHCISNYPVCSPYRGILLSGRWPYRTGVTDNGIPLSQDTYAIGRCFRDAGYRTAYIGRWHLGGTRAEPFGFDHSLIWERDNYHWDTAIYHPATGDPVQPKGYNATLKTDQALEYIRAHAVHDHPDPFFMILSLNPPHYVFTDAPEDKKALYPEGSLPYRPNVDLSNRDPEVVLYQNGSPFYEGYHAHISAIDDELGRLMAVLESLDLARNTILIYSSDHGSQQGSHGVGSKRQPYEESIRVPFLAWQPGVLSAGQTVDALFGAIDIYPTLCGLAGIAPPAHCDGQDFSPWLRGDSGPDPDSQFLMHIAKDNASLGAAHPAPIFRGIRTRRYTYAHGPDAYHALFDNAADPYQLRNVVAEPGHAERVREFADRTKRWCEVAGDPYRVTA